MLQLINNESQNLFELPYFDQSVKVFRTGSNQFDTLIKHISINKNRPMKDFRLEAFVTPLSSIVLRV